MILKDVFLALTHMCTQMTGRWIAPTLAVTETCFVDTTAYRKILEGEGLAALTEEDWEDIIWIDRSSSQPVLKWLPKFLERWPLLIGDLSQALVTHFSAMQAGGGWALFITDPLYPYQLRSIAKPPLMLSCLGDMNVFATPAVAVVGSRQGSYFGLQQSFAIGKYLANLPVTIVSGGAIGCDMAVHQGMLAASHDRIRACVVFAGGLEKLYPRRHGYFFDQILRRGGVFVSERPWRQPSLPRDFPVRNRIVSGMCEAVVVTQAGSESGSLITANEALEQGRDVYVLRHQQGDVRADGSERLLEDGAIEFATAEELVGHLGLSQKYDNSSGKAKEIHDDTCQRYRIIDTVEGEQLIN